MTAAVPEENAHMSLEQQAARARYVRGKRPMHGTLQK
jgi:hypothetical protein